MFIECAIEKYTVDVEIDENSGQVIRETWHNARGEIDRLNDLPAQTEYSLGNGQIVRQDWYKRGKWHRDGDKPASLSYSEKTGTKIAEAYWENNRPHRSGGKPSCVKWNEDGSLYRKEFFRAGQLYREDGPDIEYYDQETGELIDWPPDQNGLELP